MPSVVNMFALFGWHQKRVAAILFFFGIGFEFQHYLLWHVWHTYGRASVCVRMCIVKQYETLKHLPHSSHSYGFSPVWTRSCLTFSCGRANSFPQYRQPYGNLIFFNSALVLIWNGIAGPWINVWSMNYENDSEMVVVGTALTLRGSWCAFECILRLSLFGNTLLQMAQLNFSAPSCICIWTTWNLSS